MFSRILVSLCPYWLGPYAVAIAVIVMVRMRRDFLYQLIENYFEQLINSVRGLRPHCRNFKANDFKHYGAAARAGTCQAHMRCRAAIDKSVHLIWRNRFVGTDLSTFVLS